MKIDGVIIKDKETGQFFGFVRQFPGICAQADTVEETDRKVNVYYKAFIDRIKNEQVDMRDEEIATM
jgi:predicted RNase H-like HicB family nuclease